MKKRIVSLVLATALVGTLMVGCTKDPAPEVTGFDTTNDITVVSREDGSGTRGAFVELIGIEEKDATGNKVDKTTKEAVIAGKTDIMLTNVSSDEYAIGYVSTGSLNDGIKALMVDGAAPTTENIKNGSYKVARPFNIATKGEPTGLAKDFIDFIMSAEGQEVVAKSYIKIDDAAVAYGGDKPAGKIVIAGSSSVTPIMEKLKEAYIAMNPAAEIEIQQSDSSAGMKAVADGTCDIGMASRDLKETEKADLTGKSIAIDGIAIIVNPANTMMEITSEQVKSIFTGQSLVWSDIIQ